MVAGSALISSEKVCDPAVNLDRINNAGSGAASGGAKPEPPERVDEVRDLQPPPIFGDIDASLPSLTVAAKHDGRDAALAMLQRLWAGNEELPSPR